jgi:hypothetical protein
VKFIQQILERLWWSSIPDLGDVAMVDSGEAPASRPREVSEPPQQKSDK